MYAKPNKIQGMTVVYDGECPFCANYVRLMALRKQAGSVELIDARDGGHAVVADLKAKGYDLNEGMAAIWGGKIYYGPDAVVLISNLTEDGGWAKRLMAAVLRDPVRARRFYPFMKAGRRIVLRALGKPDIPPVLT
jgi:predicted DCC family thiol-disulfide oxidoreductase YuxK